MTQAANRDYFERRHRESVERARSAPDPAIARVHEDFAARYAAALAKEPPSQVPDMK